MTISALITGTLHKMPTSKTTSSGNAFMTATVRFQQKNRSGEAETVYCSVVAFRDEAIEALARLKEGDAVSCGGTLTVGVWNRDGKPCPSLSMVVDTVAAARPRPKERKSAAGKQAPSRRCANTGFDDPLTF